MPPRLRNNEIEITTEKAFNQSYLETEGNH